MGRFTIAVTLGDPRGIGPEVMVRAACTCAEEARELEFVFLGGQEPRDPLPSGAEIRIVPGWDQTERGAGTVSTGALQAGVELCLTGQAHALVTGPVNKKALWASGTRVPGQTELLQTLTNAPAVGMLMAAEESLLGSPLRVLLATTHIPLREVPDVVTGALLMEQAHLLHESLSAGWGLPSPEIAMCALNPHASDGGLFGDEEARIMGPAVASLESQGMAVRGPIPADTVFRRAAMGEFDAVIAPYHDVGMAAFKSLSFGGGVNTTLGLPFPRTSPDHGTAFDLVGSGKADWGSALEALRLAHRLAEGGAKQ